MLQEELRPSIMEKGILMNPVNNYRYDRQAEGHVSQFSPNMGVICAKKPEISVQFGWSD